MSRFQRGQGTNNSKTMIVIAHRGWWTEPSMKNSQESILRAFRAGFGVETDVRDHDGTLVLSHDMPRGDRHTPFEWVVQQFAEAGQPGALAINIKADGLHSPLVSMLKKHGVENAFVFDMAVPDALGYLRHDVTVFTRHSEIEPVPAFYDRAGGVWMDCFERDWILEDDVRGHLQAGKKVALVSPELHARSHDKAWAEWRPLRDAENVMVCTDFPADWKQV